MKKKTMVIKNPNPMHPGKVLAEVYMADLGVNQSELARMLGCSHAKINEIVNGKRGITAEFALVLEKELGTTAEMWVRMQAENDLGVARKKTKNVAKSCKRAVAYPSARSFA